MAKPKGATRAEIRRGRDNAIRCWYEVQPELEQLRKDAAAWRAHCNRPKELSLEDRLGAHLMRCMDATVTADVDPATGIARVVMTMPGPGNPTVTRTAHTKPFETIEHVTERARLMCVHSIVLELEARARGEDNQRRSGSNEKRDRDLVDGCGQRSV
jgi:hypothetical protein